MSEYSDCIFQLNSATLKLNKKIKIHSKYTKIGTDLMPTDDNNMLTEFLKDINLKGRTEGYIRNIKYDEVKQEYYIIVFHKIPISTPIHEQGNGKRPFSVIIADKNFKEFREYKFDHKTYVPDNMLFSKQGVMFFDRKIKNKNFIYSILDFQK